MSSANGDFLVDRADRRGELDGETESSWMSEAPAGRQKSKPVLSLMNSVMSGRVLENGEACSWLSFSHRGKKLACDISLSDLGNATG